MKLTREMCEEALRDVLYDGSYDGEEIINQLISEYFDNEPLKEDELELYAPYWDIKEETWCMLATGLKYFEPLPDMYVDLTEEQKRTVDVLYFGGSSLTEFEYEQNRYYRHKVEE